MKTEPEIQDTMKHYLSYGGGVDSTCILALICLGKLKYKDLTIIHADVACGKRNAENPDTYVYLDYIKEKIKAYNLEIVTVSSHLGSITDYCDNHSILPMRHMKWCTAKWKIRPIQKYIKEHKPGTSVIGINADEINRSKRFTEASFPLIEMSIGRKECKEIIKSMGWKVPVKSGCFFCHNAKMKEFKLLFENHPEWFKRVCEMEKKALKRLNSTKLKGWYDERRLLHKAILKRFPETHKDQVRCIHCFT